MNLQSYRRKTNKMVGWEASRKLYQPFYRHVDHHIKINPRKSSVVSSVQDINNNLKVDIDRYRAKSAGNVSVNKHVQVEFSSFFLYTDKRRSELPRSLLGCKKYHCMLVEWRFLPEEKKREISARLHQEDSFGVFEQAYQFWVNVMHHTGHKSKHDDILKYISGFLDRDRFRTFVDIEGYKTENGGTIPPDILVTKKRPDIVVVDDKNKRMGVWELVVPISNIQTVRQAKEDKYEHLTRNIKHYQVDLHPFAVESVTGILSHTDKGAIKSLHKFCKKGIKQNQLIGDIQAIASLDYKELLHMLI